MKQANHVLRLLFQSTDDLIYIVNEMLAVTVYTTESRLLNSNSSACAFCLFHDGGSNNVVLFP